MYKHLILAALVLASGEASATVLASSTFDTSDEGWKEGQLGVPYAGPPVVYEGGDGYITTDDNAQAFTAPAKFLGDQSAAFGGTLSFQLRDKVSAEAYGSLSPVSLITDDGATVYYANVAAAPSGDHFTTYTVSLVGSSFYNGGSAFGEGPVPVTDAQLKAALASLDQLAITAYWNLGSDDSANDTALDNVFLSSPSVAGVPEPASWAVMLCGFGLIGVARRYRQGRIATS